MTVLEGKLVRLRPLSSAEYPDVFAWYNDPDIVAPFDRFSVDTFDAFSHAVVSAPEDPNSLAPRFAVEPRGSGKVVGVVGYYRAHPVLEYTDVWYVLGDRGFRGRGIGRESVRLLTDHLFATSAVERVGATCDVENVPSYRLLEGLGFRHEGTLRSALFHHSRWHDVRVYGVTRAEWAAKVPRD
jgi:RimJ/RimL family protein N-acetyltransferase